MLDPRPILRTAVQTVRDAGVPVDDIVEALVDIAQDLTGIEVTILGRNRASVRFPGGDAVMVRVLASPANAGGTPAPARAPEHEDLADALGGIAEGVVSGLIRGLKRRQGGQ